MSEDAVVAFETMMFESHQLDPAVRLERGLTIVEVDDRAGEATASAYVLGAHVVIFCDAAVADRVAGFSPGEGDGPTMLDRYAGFASSIGAEVLGSGVMRVLTSTPRQVDGVVALDRDEPNDVERIRELLDSATADDLDEAEIDIDALDPIIRATESTPGGALSAYASAYSWASLGGMWDIGVLTHPAHRRQGLGGRAVGGLVSDLVARGHAPLYRHDVDNHASAGVAESVGFEVAARLTAIRFS